MRCHSVGCGTPGLMRSAMPSSRQVYYPFAYHYSSTNLRGAPIKVHPDHISCVHRANSLLEDVNKRMRTKQPAALFERKSISHSISKRDFLVVPRGCARFLLSAFFLLIACSALAQSNSQPGTAKFDGKLWWNYVKVLANEHMEDR